MIDHILIISLFVIGYCCTFWDGMIFEDIAKWFEGWLPENYRKPLYECFICACFWWGSLLYWIVWHVSLLDWFITVVAAMGLNAFIARVIEKSEDD